VDIVNASLKKAKMISPLNWRVNLAIVNQKKKAKDYKTAAAIAKKEYFKNKNISIMGMRYADALLKLGEYKQSLSFLENFYF